MVGSELRRGNEGKNENIINMILPLDARIETTFFTFVRSCSHPPPPPPPYPPVSSPFPEFKDDSHHILKLKSTYTAIMIMICELGVLGSKLKMKDN